MNTIEFLRQFRVGPFAIFDFAVSYIGFFLASPLIIKLFAYLGVTVTKTNIMWLVLPLSILTHLIIGKHTPLTKMFLNFSDYYTLKILVIYMVYAGSKGIIF